ncbi:MAG: hypothetical protein WKF97_24895 [Chitinophagaceae bacterium]
MNKVILYFLLICLSFIALHPAFGQNNHLISGEFSSVKFDRFVEKIREGTSYRFYYIPAEVDSFYVTIIARELSMPVLLNKIFSNTPFHFAIDTLHRVFITKHVVIHTTLAPGFFEKSKGVGDTIVNERVVSAMPGLKPAVKSNVENKIFEIGSRLNNLTTTKSTLAGYVRDAKNGEPIIGASIYIDSLALGVVTDQFGYYSGGSCRGKDTYCKCGKIE